MNAIVKIMFAQVAAKTERDYGQKALSISINYNSQRSEIQVHWIDGQISKKTHENDEKIADYIGIIRSGLKKQGADDFDSISFSILLNSEKKIGKIEILDYKVITTKGSQSTQIEI